MSRLLPVHCNEAGAAQRATRLRRTGHRVQVHSQGGGVGLKELGAKPPDAVVIDLARLPSHGRAVGVYFRQTRATRDLPLVFVEGDPQKTARVRETLPDAVYCSWRGIRGAITRALARPPRAPLVPRSISGYSGKPLPGKLGIRASSRVRMLAAPAGFERTLGALPEGARLGRGARGAGDVVLWFVADAAALSRGFERAARTVAPGGRLWVVWPKKTSPLARDLGGNEVRAYGLARRGVDYKLCAVDADRSGPCFSRRRGQGVRRAPWARAGSARALAWEA